MRLALRLGRTRRELLASITSEELTLWRAFDSIEPIGDARMDLGFGIVASTVANYAGKSLKEGAPLATPLDFIPLAPRPKVSPAQKLRAILLNLVPPKKGH